MVIFNMNLEVLGEMIDALTQECNLHFRRAGVRLMKPELLHDSVSLFLSNSHIFSALLLSLSFCFDVLSTIRTMACKAKLNVGEEA